MKIELVREVAAPIGEVWEFFNDIPRVVTCMPGASLTKVVDDETFEGTLGMKVGPIAVNYQGAMHRDDMNLETHTVHMTGSGKDKKGAGSAQAKITATLEPSSPTSTRMSVSSDVRLTGRVASLGRGVQDVAAKIFEEFARRASEDLTRPDPAPESAERQVAEADSEPRPGGRSPSGVPAQAAPGRRSKQQNDINVLALIWSILRDKVSGAFDRRRSKRAARAQRGK